MRQYPRAVRGVVVLALFAMSLAAMPGLGRSRPCEETDGPALKPDDILQGLRDFYKKTARPDGSFAPGVDPDYIGMSDCAYSDLAAVTYAVTIHKTFGWKLPFEDKTVAFLL